MPKKPLKAEINNFVGGLITESNALSFPQNASTEIENFVLNRDGSIKRRLGFDLEPRGVLVSPPSSTNSVFPPEAEVFKWVDVAGISDFSVLVVQTDNAITLYNLDSESLSSVVVLCKDEICLLHSLWL